VFTRSLRLYSTDVWALNNRGVAFKKLGKVEKARRDFEESLRIDPGFVQARKNLEGLPSLP
jgi:Flp pilus assembly protein TadD